jgi:hypothetical protein
MRVRRSVISLLGGGLMALAVVVAPALAAPSERFSFQRSGLEAGAFESTCTDNTDGTVTCSGTDLFVFSGKTRAKGDGATRGGEVCTGSFTDTFNPQTGQGVSFMFESGCAQAPVVFDGLNSATIPATTITLEGESCEVVGEEVECTPLGPRDVTVEGMFTGTGPVSRERFRSFFDDGVCVSRDSSSGSFRSATFSGMVDGEPFNPEDGSIRDGRFAFSSSCSLG